jgi:hypothetical protein
MCLDCHANGHTNAAFHQNPDNRPQAARLRIETVSLRGCSIFNLVLGVELTPREKAALVAFMRQL